MTATTGPTISEQHPPISWCVPAQTFRRIKDLRSATSRTNAPVEVHRNAILGLIMGMDTVDYRSQGRIIDVATVNWAISAESGSNIIRAFGGT
jgi:hypothetical protein